RLVREDKLAFGFRQDALTDQMAGRYSRRTFDMIVETVGGHRQPLRIKTDHAFLSEVLVDEAPQLLDTRIGARQRHSAAPRAANRQPHDFNGNESEQTTHRQSMAFAGERTFLVEISTQRG